MPHHRSIRVHPALVVLVSLVAGSCVLPACRSSDPRAELHERLDETVAGEGRRAELAELLDARDTAQAEFRLEREDVLTRFRALNADYDASNDELAAILDEFDPLWLEHREAMISSSLAMRALLSPDEWEKVAERDIESILAGPAGMR